ncbi:MAG: hypothetical protein ACOYK9_01995 [Chlamydiia bacterium]
MSLQLAVIKTDQEEMCAFILRASEKFEETSLCGGSFAGFITDNNARKIKRIYDTYICILSINETVDSIEYFDAVEKARHCLGELTQDKAELLKKRKDWCVLNLKSPSSELARKTSEMVKVVFDKFSTEINRIGTELGISLPAIEFTKAVVKQTPRSRAPTPCGIAVIDE